MMDELSKGIGKIHDAKPVEGKEHVVSGILMFYPRCERREIEHPDGRQIETFEYAPAFTDRAEWDTRFYEVHNYLQG